MLQDVFNDLNLIQNKLEGGTFFLFKYSSFGKIKSIYRTIQLKMIQSSFLFANIINKIAKLTSSINICFVSSNLYEIHETVSEGH